MRIRRSASKLFSVSGFAETTINDVASEAGVAPQTVYAVYRSKRGVVASVLEDLEEEADEPARVAEIIATEDPHRQLRLFVAMNRALFEGRAPIVRAALAGRDDPDVAAFVDQGDQNRRRGTEAITGVWARGGALRHGVDHDEATQRLWLLTSPQQYLLATDKLGWDPDRYEQWLGDLLDHELLS